MPLYRLVKPSGWYIAVVSKERIPEFYDKDTAFNVEFTAGSGEQLTAKVADVKEDSGKYIYYLQFDDFKSSLLTPRYLELKISAQYVGIKVPASAVKTVDGATGIYVKDGGGKRFVEVDVLIEKDGEACVQPVDIPVDIGEECEVFS